MTKASISLTTGVEGVNDSTAVKRPQAIRSVLLATGDCSLTESVRDLLHRSDSPRFGVTPATGPKAVDRRLRRGGIDLVLVDLGTGYGPVLPRVRQIVETGSGVPVIALVGGDDRKIGLAAVRAGAYAYLLKEEMDSGLLPSTVESAIEHHRTAEQLRRSERRLALAVQGADKGLWDWDLSTDSVFYSSRWNNMLGLASEDLVDTPRRWFSRIHRDDVGALRRAVDAHLSGRRDRLEVECRIRTVAGESLWVLVEGKAECDSRGRPSRLAGWQTDIHARKEAEEQILHDAMHDSLTGLPNRTVFLDRVSLALARLSRRPTAHFTVLFLDLDGFKRINDTLGHPGGDRVLILVAERLSKFLRPEDTVARLCGDEFAVLLAEVDEPTMAAQVAERIQEVLVEPFDVDGNDVRCSASIGVAISTSTYTEAHELLRDADVAMYRTKAAGGCGYQVFDAEMHRTAITLMKMESELRDAVTEQRFVMHYQPVIDLDTARIVGFEGLVRWNHPRDGLIPPTRFLAVAESSGVVIPMGWWVIEQACGQIKRWQAQFPGQPQLWVSVNISGKLFRQAEMVDRLVQILENTGLDPASLRLEFAENVVADQGEHAISRLMELRALGIRLSVDDFGSGFASLALIDRFKFDTLKIDPSCLSCVNEPGAGPSLLETILTLARSLDMGVIAEGVETSRQADYLRQRNCPHGQGFWFSHPLDVINAELLLTKGPVTLDA